MSKIIIFGNSGAGKSTLAKKIVAQSNCAHLDLDTIAWQNTSPPVRVSLNESKKHIEHFLAVNRRWVIEGCYADLLNFVASEANKAVFLHLSVEDCIKNAKSRPWEPHKYKTAQDQQANLNMLINWIEQYPHRNDTFSEQAHLNLFHSFEGEKDIIRQNN